jgi:hypothetical protein
MATKLKIILLLILFLISPASAKFICGETTSPQEISSSWYEVKTSPLSNENYFSTCLVSPSNNRYCCDLDIIKDLWGYQWKAGDIFSLKITDTSSGYFAPEKNITLTGQGYDVASNLILQKAIEIKYPNTTLTISKEPFPFQFKISPDCHNTTTSQENTSFGKNEISITTTCNKEYFTTEKTFFIIESITFQKTYSEFKGTSSKPKIGNLETETINLKGELSSSVENIKLKEYIPKSWEISEISNNGILQSSTLEYNVITWEITGDNFNFNYKIKSPDVGLIPEHFAFKTIIDEHELDSSTVQVYKILPLPLKPKILSGYVYSSKQLSKVSQELPLVFTSDSLSSALYSKKPKEDAAFNLLEQLYNGKLEKNLDFIKYYQIQTTLSPDERGKIVFEYEINKTLLKEKDYKEIGFFESKGGSLLRITGGVISSNENSIKYRFESDSPLDEIFILGEKNQRNIWNKILTFLSKIKFW